MLKQIKKQGNGLIIRLSPEDMKCYGFTLGDVIDVKFACVPTISEEKKDYAQGYSNNRMAGISGGGTEASAEKAGWEAVIEGRKERAEFEESEKKIREATAAMIKKNKGVKV